jgi:serine/threonine-protein kinase
MFLVSWRNNPRRGLAKMALATGQTFGNYQVVRLVGEGGFGEVYEAQNQFLQRRAAIKVLHKGMGEDPELVRRFLNEARAASAIRHPNIIEVLDAGVTPEGEPYILMEFLEGDSLHRLLLQQGRMPVRMVQEVARQAGSALAAAHAAGIVHRDLKPENVFLMPDPASPMGIRVKVLDFGIAKVRLRGAFGSTVRTQTGMVMGSPAYMSPEQCRDSSDVDHRSDIYSLAVMVYEMLAGVPPFASPSTTGMFLLQITASPTPLRSQVPDVPDYIEQAVMRSLSKEREQRYDRVDYFVGALLGTYPALTNQGSAVFAGKDSANPTGTVVYSATNPGNRPPPSPAVGLARASAAEPSPASVVAPGASVTILSHATREAASPPAASVRDVHVQSLSDAVSSPAASVSDVHVQGARSRKWPIFAAVGAVAAGLALLLVLRPGTSPAPVVAARPTVGENAARVAPSVAASAMVLVRVSSSPAGATVMDAKEGAVLGQTPFEKSYPQGHGVLGVVLRLAGYQDKPVTIGLDANSSTSVDLAPNAAGRPDVANRPAARRAEHPAEVGARRTPLKIMQGKEEKWRVH